MDPTRFDNMSKALGEVKSRRQALTTLAAGAAGGLAAMFGVTAKAAPAKGGHVKADCCPPDHPALCGGLTCLDLQSDPAHCGACGNQCGAGQTCLNGACTSQGGSNGTVCFNGSDCQSGNCVDGFCCDTACAGTCVSCGVPGSEGTCSSTAGVSCGAPACNGNHAITQTCDGNGTCVSTTMDCSPYTCNGGSCLQTCGGDIDCASGNTCIGGQCVAAQCSPGAIRSCYSGPAGSQGIGICAAGTQTCQANGQWETACVGEVLPGTETCNNLDDDCDGVVDNGYDLLTDPNNCGSCGHVCSFPNATAGCRNGTCVIAACLPGYHDCDGNPANGCEYFGDTCP